MTERQKVEDLAQDEPVDGLELVVLQRYPRRLIEAANYRGNIAAACGRDETGIIGIVLWGNQVKEVKTGDVIRIEGGICTMRENQLVVSARDGSIEVLER